jgi:hypothetical protein
MTGIRRGLIFCDNALSELIREDTRFRKEVTRGFGQPFLKVSRQNQYVSSLQKQNVSWPCLGGYCFDDEFGMIQLLGNIPIGEIDIRRIIFD